MKKGGILFLGLFLFFVGCAGEKEDFTKLKAYSIFGELQITPEGKIIIPEKLRWLDTSFLITVKDKEGKVRYLVYAFPGEKEVYLNEENTALSLVLMNPVLLAVDERNRDVLALGAYQIEDFKVLVERVREVMKKKDDVIQPWTVGIAADIADKLHEKIFRYNPGPIAQRLSAELQKLYQDSMLKPDGLFDFLNSAWKLIKGIVAGIFNTIKNFLISIGQLICIGYDYQNLGREPSIIAASPNAKIRNYTHIYYGYDVCKVKLSADQQKRWYDCVKTSSGSYIFGLSEAKWSSFNISFASLTKFITEGFSVSAFCQEYTEVGIPESWHPSDTLQNGNLPVRIFTYKGYQRTFNAFVGQGQGADCLYTQCGDQLGAGDGTLWGTRGARAAFIANTLKIMKMVIKIVGPDIIQNPRKLAYCVEALVAGGDWDALKGAMYSTSVGDIIGYVTGGWNAGNNFLNKIFGIFGNLLGGGTCGITIFNSDKGLAQVAGEALSQTLSTLASYLTVLGFINRIIEIFTAYIPFVIDLIQAPATTVHFLLNGVPGASVAELVYFNPQQAKPGMTVYVGGYFGNGNFKFYFKKKDTGQVYEGSILSGCSEWCEATILVPYTLPSGGYKGYIKLLNPAPLGPLTEALSKSAEYSIDVYPWAGGGSGGQACKIDPKTGKCVSGGGGGGCSATSPLSETLLFITLFLGVALLVGRRYLVK